MITLFSLMISPHKTAQIIPFSGINSTKADKSSVIFSFCFFLLDQIPGATNILCFQLRLIRGVEERRTRGETHLSSSKLDMPEKRCVRLSYSHLKSEFTDFFL